MHFLFDLRKDEVNQTKHGVSLADAARLNWRDLLISLDKRRPYGEKCHVGFGAIDHRLHCIVYTECIDGIRVISLRKANAREQNSYEQNASFTYFG